MSYKQPLEEFRLFWDVKINKQPVELVAAQTHVELWGGPLDATVWMCEGDVKTAGHYEYVLKYPVGGKYVKETIDNVVRLTYYGPEDFD